MSVGVVISRRGDVEWWRLRRGSGCRDKWATSYDRSKLRQLPTIATTCLHSTFRTHRPTVSGVVQVGQGHSSTEILPDLPNIGAFSVITIYDQCRLSQQTVITSHNSATRRKKQSTRLQDALLLRVTYHCAGHCSRHCQSCPLLRWKLVSAHISGSPGSTT